MIEKFLLVRRWFLCRDLIPISNDQKSTQVWHNFQYSSTTTTNTLQTYSYTEKNPSQSLLYLYLHCYCSLLLKMNFANSPCLFSLQEMTTFLLQLFCIWFGWNLQWNFQFVESGCTSFSKFWWKASELCIVKPHIIQPRLLGNMKLSISEVSKSSNLMEMIFGRSLKSPMWFHRLSALPYMSYVENAWPESRVVVKMPAFFRIICKVPGHPSVYVLLKRSLW